MAQVNLGGTFASEPKKVLSIKQHDHKCYIWLQTAELGSLTEET